MFKDLLDRARRVAEENLPQDVVDAGRKLGRTVAAHAPAPLAEVIHYVTGEEDEDNADEGEHARAKEDTASAAEAKPSEAPKPKTDAPSDTARPATAASEAREPEPTAAEEPTPTSKTEAGGATSSPLRREDPRAVLDRVHEKAERGLKPEDRLVVIYATPEHQEDIDAIEATLEQVEAEVRHNDLRREPQTARQLAKLTGVMVPPYVFINGKHWGNRYDVEALAVSGDLELVVANRLDEISEEARRIGGIRESFSDEMTADNIVHRWKLGHILCVDDLDSWYEVDRAGEGHFYFGGGPQSVDDMRKLAQEVADAVEAEEYEAVWQLEPSVHLP